MDGKYLSDMYVHDAPDHEHSWPRNVYFVGIALCNVMDENQIGVL